MIKLPNTILCFFINKKKIGLTNIVSKPAEKKNGNKILNFPTLSWQPNRITTSRTIKKIKTFSIIFIILDFIVKEKNENFNFFQLFHTFLVAKQNHNKPNHNKKKMKTFTEKTGGNGLSDLHFTSFLPIGIEARISTL